MFGILQSPRRYLASGGGLIAFTLSASQTTLLSFYVAHHLDTSSLAVFGFLISVHYFAIQLLRRNVVEPYFQFKEIASITQEKRQISLVFLFVTLIYLFSIFVSDLYKLILGMMCYSVISIFWEMRKAALRVSNKIHIYTSLEFATVIFIVCIVILNIAGIELPSELLILSLAFLQIMFLFFTTSNSTIKAPNSAPSNSYVKISSNGEGEFIYLLAIICSNAYLLNGNYSVELGEIRSVFLFLLVSTFSIGALRNSLSLDLKWSKIDIFLLLAYFGNIITILVIPANILRRLIPSFPLEPGFLVLIISLDTLGSLIFLLLSLKLMKERNMKSSANARLVSSFALIIFFFYFRGENLSVFHIGTIFASSSLIGAFYLLMTTSFARYKLKIWKVP